MKHLTIDSFVNACTRNAMVTIESTTTPKMNKTNNPFYGRVTKHSIYSSVCLGRNYQKTCTNRGDSETYGEYQVEKPKGRTWVQFPFILCADKDATQKYLRIAKNENSTINSTWYVDGRKATESEIAEIKTFLTSHSSGCKKQAAYGIQKEVEVFDLKFESITLLKQGEEVYEP